MSGILAAKEIKGICNNHSYNNKYSYKELLFLVKNHYTHYD